MEGRMGQQAHGTQIHSQFTGYYHGYSPYGPYNCSFNNYQQLPSSGNTLYGYSPYGPYNCSFNNYQQLPSSGNTLYGVSVQLMDSVGGSQENHNPQTFGVTCCQDSRRFTFHERKQGSILHFSKYPKHGDIFRYQGYDNVLILDFVSTENPQEHQSLPSSEYPSDGELFRVHESLGLPTLERVGDKIFTFHEENRTASHYLPDKDIVLHFTKVPRDGDIFCGRQNDGVVILEVLSPENSYHNKLPQDRDLYRVHEGNGGFSVMKLENNNMNTKDSYIFGRVTQEENSTFTCYLQDKDMAFHFTSVPAHDAIFRSQQRNNIMILDMFPPENYKENPKLRSYGCPWDIDYFRVQQTDDGFELVRIVLSKLCRNIEGIIQRQLNIRRHVASNTSSAKEDDACAVCLAPYKEFDRIGSMACGHEYHVSCIIPWLRQNWICFICKEKLCLKSQNSKD